MSNIYYRLCNLADPEERLEDAALFKALHDQFGLGLTSVSPDDIAPHDGLFLGRGRKSEHFSGNHLASTGLQYWKDPAFLENISRSFMVTDFKGAEAEVNRLHAEGKDAFIKSTKQKHMVMSIKKDETFSEAIGDWAYSFIDIPDCLMVQEYVDMSWERRFLVMNGQVVTHSPVAWHLTPLSRYECRDETGLDIDNMHYRTPQTRDARFSPEATERMLAFAQKVADASEEPHLCIDLAVLGEHPDRDPIEVIEFNPMQPGSVGLYACSPQAVARGVYASLAPEVRQLADARKAGHAAPGEIPSVGPSVVDMLTGKQKSTKKFSSFAEFMIEDEPFEDMEFEDESDDGEPASP